MECFILYFQSLSLLKLVRRKSTGARRESAILASEFVVGINTGNGRSGRARRVPSDHMRRRSRISMYRLSLDIYRLFHLWPVPDHAVKVKQRGDLMDSMALQDMNRNRVRITRQNRVARTGKKSGPSACRIRIKPCISGTSSEPRRVTPSIHNVSVRG